MRSSRHASASGQAAPDLATSEEDRNTKDPMWVAIEALGPGDFLVMDCGGIQTGATTGDILAARIEMPRAASASSATARSAMLPRSASLSGCQPGVSACRDSASRRIPRQPGLEPAGPLLPGQTVIPGDYILADDDGAVVIPAHMAEEIAQVAGDQESKETFIRTLVQDGVLPGQRVLPARRCDPGEVRGLEEEPLTRLQARRARLPRGRGTGAFPRRRQPSTSR